MDKGKREEREKKETRTKKGSRARKEEERAKREHINVQGYPRRVTPVSSTSFAVVLSGPN